jgi:hypothetical protein
MNFVSEKYYVRKVTKDLIRAWHALEMPEE